MTMHPYSVWIKDVLNGVFFDIRNDDLDIEKKDAELIDAYKKLIRLIYNEINQDAIRVELQKIESEIGHMRNDLTVSIRLSDLLAGASIETESITRIYYQGNALVLPKKHKMPDTYSCFNERALRELMSINASVGVDPTDITPISHDENGVPTEPENCSEIDPDTGPNETPGHNHQLNAEGTPDKPGAASIVDTRRFGSRPFLLFLAIVIGVGWLMYRYGADILFYGDLLVFSAVSVVVWRVLFHPKARFFRLTMLMLTILFSGKGLGLSIEAEVIKNDASFLVSISEQLNDPLVQLGLLICILVFAILDFFERKRE